MLRRALYELAPERGQPLPERRLERRDAVERRQLLTTIAPADERRQFNRRELDRAQAELRHGAHIDRTAARTQLRKGLLLDVYA